MRCFLSAVSLALIGLACSDPTLDPTLDPSFVWANPPGCDSAAPAVSLPAAQRDSLPADLGLIGEDASYYNVSQHVPGGWGGFYMTPVNGRNTPVVLLVDTTDLLAALDTLKKFYPDRSFTRDSSLVRVVRWDWIRLSEWYAYFRHAGLPDVNYGDMNQVTNRLEFGSGSAQGRQATLQRLKDLHAPCWLAAVNEYGGAVLK